MKQLQQHLATSDGVELHLTASGVDGSGTVDAKRFTIQLFAVDFAENKAGFSACIEAPEIAKLHDYLAQFRNLITRSNDTAGLRVVDSSAAVGVVLDILADLDDAALAEVIAALSAPGKFDWLSMNLAKVATDDLERALRFTRRQSALQHLKQLIEEDSRIGGDVSVLCDEDSDLRRYASGLPETVFQRWFEANTWIFGREYVRRHPLRSIGMDSEADLIMETTDGHLDVVELKRPRANVLVRGGERSTPKYHHLAADVTAAYGQCVHYLDEIENYKLQLQEKYNARIVAPRVFLIIGRSHDFTEVEVDSLRRIASTFHQIQVLTYDQILAMGHQLIADETPTGSASQPHVGRSMDS